MAAPERAAAVRALELLADGLLAERVLAGESPAESSDVALVEAVAEELTCVLYRVLLVEVARARGATVGWTEALAGLELTLLSVPEVPEPLLSAAGALLGAQADWDHRALGALHQDLVALGATWDGATVRWASAGTGRRRAGAWFTPADLVDHLLDESLGPLVAEAAETGRDLLDLTVCDPACGAGAFLVAAAHRIAEQARAPLAEVLARCVHGADLDRRAVELTRVGLWLELVEAGTTVSLPALRLTVGDALLGATPALAAGGVPPTAFRGGAGSERRGERLRAGAARRANHVQERSTGAADPAEVADGWCAAFVWPLDQAALPPLTTHTLDELARGTASDPVRRTVAGLADRHRFLHWPWSFPEVFARGGFDLVVGNPPFLNQLGRLSAVPARLTALQDAHDPGVLRPYTDVSAAFLHRAVDWVRDGGRVALVQPQSVLAARDAGGVRARVADRCALEALWATDRPVFDASVLTCALVLRRGAVQGHVRRTHGPGFRRLPTHEVLPGGLDEEWAFLLAAGLGVPEVHLGTAHGTVGDQAACTADFRDQYYGLAPYVTEAASLPQGTPLVTTGLVEPAGCRWGSRATRFLKQQWAAPVVDVAALAADPGLARWAATRLVPKILVGTQGRVVEAVADPGGRWLPSVPTITVVPDPGRLWHVLAVLLSPPVTAYAAARYAGTALTMRAVKLSAAQVARLPLPPAGPEWDQAALLVQEAQADPARRHERLLEAGAHMVRAYGVDAEVQSWWVGRLSQGGRSARPAPR